MTSPVQVAANRANSQLSTGPITEAGKHAVAQNSLKHGLTGTVHAALPGEEEALEKHCQDYRQAYAPVGAPEHDLVRNIAENHWRLKRAHAMENALFIQLQLERTDELPPAAANAEAWVDPLKGLQRIALYAGRIQRAIEKNTAELKVMQAERKAAYAQARDEAIVLTQLAASKGQTIDPARDFPSPESNGGFVYAPEEIARILSRARRLEEARARFGGPDYAPTV
jgi:hypothetical protein